MKHLTRQQVLKQPVPTYLCFILSSVKNEKQVSSISILSFEEWDMIARVDCITIIP
ncbi:MAG: hypothetical protein Q8904_13030 [Bacteroidota bacterium]|nr:hypothetical protein [Bacteroidota bacterium]